MDIIADFSPLGGRCMVRINGEFAAGANVVFMRARNYIDNVFTASEYRRLGCARALLEKILSECINGKRFELEVYPDNDAAISLYESLGFKIVSPKPDRHGLLKMIKEVQK